MDDPLLSVPTRREGDVVVIGVEGEVDAATAPLLAQAFRVALEGGPKEIELDCAKLSFLDSSGVRVLIQAWSEVRDRVAPVSVYVSNLQPGPRRVLEICGVSDLLTR